MAAPQDSDIRIALEKAYRCAYWSEDPSTQVGAYIITGPKSIRGHACNTIPGGVQKNGLRFENPLKQYYVEHAERTAIYRCAREGFKLSGASMVSTWACCADCARAIIESGICAVITHKWLVDRTPERWQKSIEAGHSMLREAGVALYLHDGPVPYRSTIRFNGEEFRPW